MSKDDMETRTMNVMFSGKDDTDDIDTDKLDRAEKIKEYFEDDYYMYYKLKRYSQGRWV